MCNICREQSHWIEQCPYKDCATPPAGYLCHKCHQAGHWVHLCPAARTARASGAAAAAAAEAEAAPPLAVEMEHEMAGDEIAEALDEEAVEVRHTMARVVAALGEEVARQLLVQTWQACDLHRPALHLHPPPSTSTSTSTCTATATATATAI